MVTWTGQFAPSAKAEIEKRVKEAEAYFGVAFPPSFLAIATSYPKAEAEPNGIGLPDGSGTGLGHLLHFEEGTGAEGFSNIISRIFPVEEVLEKGIIPFAEDVGGDLFCFNYRDDPDHPHVVFWSVDTGTLRLASSFDDFVAMLRE